MFFPMHREKHPFCFVPGKGTKTTVFPDASRKTAWGQNSDLFKNGGQNGDKTENDPCFSRCIEKNGGDKLDSMRCISQSVFRPEPTLDSVACSFTNPLGLCYNGDG